VDGLPLAINTLPYYDIRALQDIHDFVSVEPAQERDKVMIGMLAAIASSSTDEACPFGRAA
jgi:hypothetical protein